MFADASFADLNVESPDFGDFSWQGTLTAEAEQFVLSGEWKLQVPRACSKCNGVFVDVLSGEIDEHYTIEPKHEEMQAELELTGNEPEVLAAGELDVLAALREHFWLAWQPMIVCDRECKGLCLQCGVDLNKGSCDCHKQVKENAFAALKNLKFDA